MIWFHLTVPAEGTDQSLNVRPEHSIKIVTILLIENFWQSVPQIKRYLCNLKSETLRNWSIYYVNRHVIVINNRIEM